MNQKLVSSVLAAVILGSVLARAIAAESKETDSKEVSKISYYREIRPILQANCQGCHQPAKAKGGYIMTEFKRLLSGGDTSAWFGSYLSTGSGEGIHTSLAGLGTISVLTR